MSESDVAIRADKLSCGYPSRTVLEGVTFESRYGEIVALLGPNGSGKSTLLKTIAKTVAPLGGALYINDVPIERISARQLAQKVGFVPQREEPRFGFSVRQVVAMGRAPHSDGLFETAEDHRIVDAAMDQADCDSLQDRVVAELSGGEHQRVLIARALAQQTPILILDEPTSHLDPAHHVALAALLRSLAQAGKSILVAMHDLNLAAMIAHRAMLVHDGAIAMADDMSAVLNSKKLDAGYGVEFEHVQSKVGLRLFPGRILD